MIRLLIFNSDKFRLYRSVFTVWRALSQNLMLDNIIDNNIFLVKRLWTHEDIIESISSKIRKDCEGLNLDTTLKIKEWNLKRSEISKPVGWLSKKVEAFKKELNPNKQLGGAKLDQTVDGYNLANNSSRWRVRERVGSSWIDSVISLLALRFTLFRRVCSVGKFGRTSRYQP